MGCSVTALQVVIYNHTRESEVLLFWCSLDGEVKFTVSLSLVVAAQPLLARTVIAAWLTYIM